MATRRQLRVFANMFDPNDEEDTRQYTFFLTADGSQLLRVLDALCESERRHEYDYAEWNRHRTCVRKRLQYLGLSRALCWAKQDHLLSTRSFVHVSPVSENIPSAVAYYLVYITLKQTSSCYLSDSAYIWELVPAEKKRTGLRRP